MWRLGLFLVAAGANCPEPKAYAGQSRLLPTNAVSDCQRFYVGKTGQEGCPRGLGEGTAKGGALLPMDVRAVYYVPRPIGISSGAKDLYTVAFKELHKRDLYLIAKVLRANTLRLEPWDNKEDHSNFLEQCRNLGLFVIPTFDMRYFFQEQWLRSDSLEREKEMLRHFDRLLLNVKSKDPILAWTVNHALPLNETIAKTPKDSWQADDSRRKIYFSMVAALRKGHYRREWLEDQAEFMRPLLLPVDLDSRTSDTDVAWYLALAETAWATWPTEFKDAKEMQSLKELGAFDGWIGYTTPASSHQGLDETTNQARIMALPAGDTHDRPPGSESAFPKCLEEESGVGCNFKSRKVKILQFGFGALQPSKLRYLKMEVDAVQQQTSLKEVWEHRLKQPDYRCQLAGVVIDQWADDWDRCAAERGLRSNPFFQNIGGVCDDVANDKRRHLEWFGISGQYDSFGTHCIDPRFLGRGSLAFYGFRFEEVGEKLDELDLMTDPDFTGFCHRLMPSWVQVSCIIVGCVLLVGIWCYRSWKICCHREKDTTSQMEMEAVEADELRTRQSVASRLTRARRTMVDDAAALSSALTTPASSAPASATGSHTPSEDSESSRSRAPIVKVSIQMQVPQLCEHKGARPEPLLTLEVANSRQRGLGQEQAMFHLQAHHAAQVRRLQHQVECEALSLQALGFLEAQCRKLAVANVHARAMEGYLVWLQNRAEPQRDRQGRDKVEFLLGEAEEQRDSWELWVEMLLLRTLESLAEHSLHAPEFVAAVYDRIRFGDSHDEVRVPVDAEFTLKYDLILSGVEALRRNGDPFRGGVNFDDVNELGLEGRIDTLSKTYREAASLWVVLDLLSNFQPVFVMKVWIFLLAFYAYMSQDDRNGYFWFPTFKRANALQYIALCESAGSAVLEVLIIFHGLEQWHPRSFLRVCCRAQGRGRAPLRWLLRRLFTLVLSAGCAVAVFCKMHILEIDLNAKKEDIPELRDGYSEELKEALITALVVIGLRILCYALTTRPYAIPFIEGRPKKKSSAPASQPTLPPLNASAPLLRAASQASVARSVNEDVEEQDSREERGGLATEEIQLLRDFAWLAMLTACFFFEMRFIVPLIADFEFGAFCGDTCQIRHTKHFRLITSECFACSGGLALCWSLVILTGFFDVYYIFYAGTAIFGYGMGEWRGLRNVLATALRHLDMDSGSTGRVPGYEQRRTHSHRLQISDGAAMQMVFGVSWRMVWSRIVEALYEDCVISSREANAMVQAASTVRWASETKRSLPKDQISRLRFSATQLRNGGGPKDAVAAGARHRCISMLEVQVRSGRSTGQPERRVLQDIEDFTVDCVLESEDLREGLLQALAENAETLPALKAFELPAGSKLLAVNDAWPSLKEDLVEEVQKASLPALLVFERAGISFSEVEMELSPPARVKSVSFATGKDDPSLDPVCWQVEGLVVNEQGQGVWKQLVWQDKPYLPPWKRETDLCMVFDVEHWRVSGKAGSITLQSFLPVVQERLSFFAASLRSLLRAGDKYSIRPGIDTLLDSHVGNIPSLTQVIPCYNETVILSKQFLQDEDGVNTNLGFIISQFPEEWEFFCERHGYTVKDMYKAFLSRDSPMDPTLCMEVRMWASMRSQTVARTVVGAMQYQEVVALLPSVQGSEQPGQALEHCVELVLAHQTYGSKAGTKENDEAVRYLLAKYRDRCFYLVFDFDQEKSKPALVTAVNSFVKEKYRFDRPVRYASVLAKLRPNFAADLSKEVPENALQLVEVLPRCFPLLVGTPGFMTQGKAGNQLGALRFSKGHVLQMMDANMGAFLGEASKVPFILRRFQPHWADRTTVRARIIGFREFIFTESHGAVGSVMASAEWSFGTICQRFLAGLGARMHYGHPDFLDGFWASNRGSLSKASPAINLSEDIFAGFNVRMRGESSKHVDTLAWEKGRESSFNAASLFYTKVSKGNVGVMRSRDLKVITQNMNVVDNFSFYFASIGFYLNNLLIDASCSVYVFLFILLALASKSLQDVASLDSMLATEWTLSMGTIAMFPRFMELTLEYGPLEGLLRFLPSIPGCMTMFTFINKSIASGVQETMITGEASYIATGRPNANTHYSWKECYFIFCTSHYYPALRIFCSYYVYVLVSQALGFSTLPMMVLLASSCMWLIAPIAFCPQPTLSSMGRDLNEFWQFTIATPDWSVRSSAQRRSFESTEEHLRTGLRDPRSSLYEFWLLRALEHKKFGCFQRVCFLTYDGCCLFFLLAVVYSSLLDNVWVMVLLYSIHYLLMEIWRLLYRPTVITLMTTTMWLLVPVVIEIPMLNTVVLLLVMVMSLQVIKNVVLLIVWMLLSPKLDWKKMPESTESERSAKKAASRRVLQYDMVVEYLYVNMMGHQLHLYAAVAILAINLGTQFLLVLADMLFGFHSWALLNSRLRSRTCCQRRRGYEP